MIGSSGDHECPTKSELEELRSEIRASWERSKLRDPRPPGSDAIFYYIDGLLLRSLAGGAIFEGEVDAYCTALIELGAWWRAHGENDPATDRSRWVGILRRLETAQSGGAARQLFDAGPDGATTYEAALGRTLAEVVAARAAPAATSPPGIRLLLGRFESLARCLLDGGYLRPEDLAEVIEASEHVHLWRLQVYGEDPLLERRQRWVHTLAAAAAEAVLTPLRLLEEPEELSFGEQLRLARQHAGLTVDALARLCHVNPATIWRWENNKVDPQRRLRKRLIAVLDVQYDHPSRAG